MRSSYAPKIETNVVTTTLMDGKPLSGVVSNDRDLFIELAFTNFINMFEPDRRGVMQPFSHSIAHIARFYPTTLTLLFADALALFPLDDGEKANAPMPATTGFGLPEPMTGPDSTASMRYIVLYRLYNTKDWRFGNSVSSLDAALTTSREQRDGLLILQRRENDRVFQLEEIRNALHRNKPIPVNSAALVYYRAGTYVPSI